MGVQSNPGTPNFVFVSPSSGTAPGANVGIGLNPNIVAYLPPGGYAVQVVFGIPGDPASVAGPVVQLSVTPPPPPAVTSVVSAASLQPSISPGELVSIFGANLGTPPISAQYNDSGLYPTTLGNTTVTFNGTPAALLYVSTTQINAAVPYEVAGQKNVNVVVTHDSQPSPAFSLPLVGTSPAIFTVTQTGTGQGAILSAPGENLLLAPNSADNPAPRGSDISIFGTGGGVLNQNVTDGMVPLIVLEPPGYHPAARVSLTIGGQPAHISYAGAAPFEVSSMLQINATIPQNIGSGPQPVVLTIGTNDNSSQHVTVAVQ
jgi:uncharacterized protein (TIGR03437 family)